MKTQVWAHRGASAYAPENTLEAFELAVRQGADGIELDVQMTKDKKMVVVHDETLERVSGRTGRIVDFTLRELKRLHFNKTCTQYAEARIPELREVYELLKPTNLVINVEIKTGIVRYQGIEAQVLAETAAMGMQERVIYSSFCHESLLRLKQLEPSARTGLLYSDGWVDVVSYACRLGMDALHPHLAHLQDESLMREAELNHKQIHVWTINDRREMVWAAARGVDAIITDRPDVCKAALTGGA